MIRLAPPPVPTAGVFGQTFTRLHARGIRPGVLYPAVSIPGAEDLQGAEASWRAGLPPELVQFIAGGPTFLSINRFERKKVSLGGGGRAWGRVLLLVCHGSCVSPYSTWQLLIFEVLRCS
jgi:alpha-1,3/alpha-1,6-mannosyltransferase